MSKLSNIRKESTLKAKLIFLSTLLSIFLIIVGFLGVVFSSYMVKRYDNMFDTVEARRIMVLESSETVKNLRIAFNRIAVEAEILNNVDESRNAAQTALSEADKFRTYIKKYTDNISSDSSIDNATKNERISEVQKLSGIVDEYVEIINPVLDACMVGDNEKIQTYFSDLRSIVSEINDTLDILGSSAAEAETSIRNTNKKIDKEYTVFVIIIIIAFICLAILSASNIVKGILENVKRIANATTKVADGNFDVNLRTNGRDEMSMLSNNFAHLLDTFRGIIQDMEVAAAASMNEGDIDARIDTNKYHGEYAEIAKTINKLLENNVSELKTARKTAEAYAYGDFNYTCPRFPGKKAALHECFDLMQDHLKEVSTSINTIITGVNKGDFNVKVDESKFDGDWQKIIKELNTLVKNVEKPISETQYALNEVSKGNFQVALEPDKYNGAFKEMFTDIQTTVVGLHAYITEIADVLTKMANQNLNVTIDQEYSGDFEPIKVALNLIADNFNQLVKEIMVSSDQMAIGSQSIADSSTTIAQGASEQASAVEEVSATMNLISQNTHKNMENILKSNRLADEAKTSAENVINEMNELLTAMDEINTASNNIFNIIKAIDDIAFQTNILSLNAAVEAARAGEHGKGFAVVAEEVRNLAARSQASAKETSDLIAISIEKAKHGNEIVDRNAKTIIDMSNRIDEISLITEEVVKDSQEQDKSIGEVNIGINQIAAVVSNNTAVSEESAAGAEELASQASVFKESVSKFALKGE